MVEKRVNINPLTEIIETKMKRFQIFAFLLFWIAEISFGDPITFDEFKKLPVQEQYKRIGDGSTPLQQKLYRWRWRLRMGEASWRDKEEDRLIDAHGLTTLLALFNEQQHLRESLLMQELHTKIMSGMSSTAAADSEWTEAFAAAAAKYHEAFHLLTTLAPTNEAVSLNKKAAAFFSQRYKQLEFHDDDNNAASQEKMKIFDQFVQEIWDQLNKLPKLTPEQVQAAINALPEDYPHK